MASAWTLIEDAVLGSASPTIVFNTGLGGYTKFRLTLYVIKDGTSGTAQLRLNGDTGANYAQQELSAAATSIVGERKAGQTLIVFTDRANISANSLALVTAEISKPLTSTPARVTANAAFEGSLIIFESEVGEWNNTADLISSITLLSSSGDFATGTRAVLEGAE